MCYITVLAQQWSTVEQRQRMYQALNTHTIPVSMKLSLMILIRTWDLLTLSLPAMFVLLGATQHVQF